jgi:hypothetical protein
MPREIISKIDDFLKSVPPELKVTEHHPRAKALKRYFETGGVVSLSPQDKNWPKLLYPPKAKLQEQLADLDKVRKQYEIRLTDWEKENAAAKNYHLRHSVLKLKEPLYWRHMAKLATDKEYRTDADSVKLPAHLVGDPKWKSMVQMFVEDPEYRRQLADTVQTSAVYKNDKRVARAATEYQKSHMKDTQRQIDDLREKLASIKNEQAILRELVNWASN